MTFPYKRRNTQLLTANRSNFSTNKDVSTDSKRYSWFVTYLWFTQRPLLMVQAIQRRKVKVKFALEQASQRGSRGTALLFL
jgi:hypothetical protein